MFSPVNVHVLDNPNLNLLYCNAKVAAKTAALSQHDAVFLASKAAYDELESCVLQRQRMLLAIVLARASYAKHHKLLTLEDPSDPKPPEFPKHCSAAPESSPEYFTHPDNFDGHKHVLAPCKPFSRALRFPFGEFLYRALAWYLGQLRWPDLPLDSTRGITYLEFCIDFELSTGIFLPGSEKRIQGDSSSRQRRGAAFHIKSVFDDDPPPQNDLKHDIERYVADSGKACYRYKACLRSGYWAFVAPS